MLTIYFYHGPSSRKFCENNMLTKTHDVWVIDDVKRLKSAIKDLRKDAAKHNVSICLYADEKPTGELKALIEKYCHYWVDCPPIASDAVTS